MGDRAQIAIKKPTEMDPDARIYLYGHWTGADICPPLQGVLKRGQRLRDAEYLSRIIFCAMIKGHEDGETGFGIGNSKHGDIEHIVPVIDCAKQTIQFEAAEYSGAQPVPEMSFEEFANTMIDFSNW